METYIVIPVAPCVLKYTQLNTRGRQRLRMCDRNSSQKCKHILHFKLNSIPIFVAKAVFYRDMRAKLRSYFSCYRSGLNPWERRSEGSGSLRPTQRRVFRLKFPLWFGGGAVMPKAFILTDTTHKWRTLWVSIKIRIHGSELEQQLNFYSARVTAWQITDRRRWHLGVMLLWHANGC